MNNIPLGNYLFCTKVKHFQRLPSKLFAHFFGRTYDKVSSFPLSDSQIEAWIDCFDVLKSAFSSVSEPFGELWLVFEYVLPKHSPSTKKFLSEKHIVADVIVISADTALVLEFKRRADEFEGLYKQTAMYQRRLEQYHVESNRMKVMSLLVLTKANHFRGEMNGVKSCSPDCLAEAIIDIFGDNPKGYENIGRWLQSDFYISSKKPSSILPSPSTISSQIAIETMGIRDILKALIGIDAQLKELEEDDPLDDISKTESFHRTQEVKALVSQLHSRLETLRNETRDLPKGEDG